MPEHYLYVDHVGFKRVFVTGSVPDNKDFELELNEEQKQKLQDFQSVQQAALQKFLLRLTNEN